VATNKKITETSRDAVRALVMSLTGS